MALTRMDLRLLCMALGFTALATKDGTDIDAVGKVVALARLAEFFCLTNVPGALDITNASVDDGRLAELDEAIDRYKADLRTKHEAQLPDDRETLLHFYDRLQQRQLRRRQRQFHASAADDVIADCILRMVEEEIASEGAVHDRG
jgi:hypothetical protein